MPQQDWQKKFIVTKGTPGKLNGEDVTYYPVSVKLTFALKAYAEPIAALVAALYEEKSAAKTDVGSLQRNIEKLENGEGVREFHTQPITPELAEVRHKHRAGAVQRFIDKAFGDDSQTLLMQIVMDSLREIFPRGDENNPPPSALSAMTDTPVLMEALFYVAKANAGMFGPLIEAAGVDLETLAAKAKELTAKKDTDAAYDGLDPWDVFQDEVLWVAERLQDLDRVLNMDMPAFDSTYGSMRRNEARQVLQDTRRMALAQHDPAKLADDWNELITLVNNGDMTQRDDQEAFANDLGSGGF